MSSRPFYYQKFKPKVIQEPTESESEYTYVTDSNYPTESTIDSDYPTESTTDSNYPTESYITETGITDSDAESDMSDDITESATEYTYDTQSTIKPKKNTIRLTATRFKNPEGGSFQGNMNTADMREKLKGFVQIKNHSEFDKLPIRKTWIRYINKKTGLFRIGGLLIKNSDDYIILLNTVNNITWSVQKIDNYFWKPINIADVKREINAKNKLFDLYKNGRLVIKE